MLQWYIHNCNWLNIRPIVIFISFVSYFLLIINENLNSYILISQTLYFFWLIKGGSRTGAPPPLLFGWGVVLVNFDCVTRINFYFRFESTFNVYNMYFIHYSTTLHYKNIRRCVGRGIKTNLHVYRAPRFWNSWIRHCLSNPKLWYPLTSHQLCVLK